MKTTVSKSRKRIWCVYCHTNKTNGKKYFGLTSQTPEDRWKYGYGYYNNPHFWNSIQKYGWDGFTHEIIKEGLTRKEAGKLEQQLVKKHKTNLHKYGYNQTEGGEVNIHSEETKQKMREIRNNFPKEKLEEITQKVVDKKSIAVRCIETGIEYKSAKVAGDVLNINSGSITSCCRGKQKSAGGFTWEYVNKSKAQKTPKTCPKRFKIRIRIIETGQEFESTAEASRVLHVCNKSIIRALDNPNYTCKGYHWERLGKRRPRTKKRRPCFNKNFDSSLCGKSHKKPVINLETLKVYNSIREASIDSGIIESNISACCRGVVHTSGGYHWRYVNDDKPSESD